MALEAGTRLGQYEVVGAIGAGGMGEVYRARDTRLGRDVAIKVLPDELARVQERLDRFEREAKLLAALNHANVATLYGLEHDGEQQFLVMELVEGETLAERIERGPIPFDEARELFVQIAEGLEAAHEKGIIHRDLKPANIKITPEGKVKILDFGLAKAFASESDPSTEPSQSPTLTKGTALGAIMGTAAYMSPEQARGKIVDRRTDVWAFGCCLYEALTGRRTFEGETVPDTLSAVLSKAPDWSRLPPSSPAAVHKLLERALRKDVGVRLQHVGDARVELLDAGHESSVAASVSRRTNVWLAALALVLLGFVLRLLTESPSMPEGAPLPVRVTVDLPEGHRLVAQRGNSGGEGQYPPLAVSEDGRRFVFAAKDADEIPRLYVRRLDTLEVRPLEGTDGAQLPFFSPDGEQIAFLDGGRVFKSPVRGGVPTLIGETPLGSARGAAWVSDDTIVLGGPNSALTLMHAVTGAVEPLTALDPDRRENYHAWPHALPDQEHVLFTVWRANSEAELAVVSLATKEWWRLELTAGAAQPHYLESGHLVFFRDGGLFAAPFDLSKLAIDGRIVNVPVRDLIVGRNAGLDLGYFAASRSGALVFARGTVDLLENELVRVDRSGTAEEISEPGRFRARPSLSPDGARLAANSNGIFIYDLTRRSRARVATESINPVWSSDGEQVYVERFDRGDGDLHVVSVDGSRPSEAVLIRDFDQRPVDASGDGRYLAFVEIHPDTALDIHLVRLDGSREVSGFATTKNNERGPAFSPDSRWIAYASDESGREEVYVAAVTGEGGKQLISNRGGTSPRWSRDGGELFYWQGSTMMSVAVALDPAFAADPPVPLFDREYGQRFDVFPDGDHFAMITLSDPDLRELELVVNWSTELAELVPVE